MRPVIFLYFCPMNEVMEVWMLGVGRVGRSVVEMVLDQVAPIPMAIAGLSIIVIFPLRSKSERDVQGCSIDRDPSSHATRTSFDRR
jgi:homoserine dehydrogenase